jgi:signal transduction histidine kinase
MDLNHHSKIGLVEDELVSSLAWFINIRWVAGLGVLVASWIATSLLQLSLPAMPLYLIGLGVLVYNSFFSFILIRLQKNPPHSIGAFTNLAQVQVALDYVTMTLLIHFTGGLESPALLYFFFHIVISAILLSSQVTYLYTALATLLVSGTAVLEYAALLPHIHVPEFMGAELSRSPIYILGEVFFFTSTAIVVAYLAVTLNGRLRARTTQIIDLTTRLQSTYNHMQLLYDGAQAVNSTLNLKEVLERLVRGTAEAMGVNECSIFLLDETRTRLALAARYGLSDEFANKGDLILEKNPLAREVLEGKVIAIGNVRTDSRLQYPAAAIVEGIQSILSAPLIGKDGPLGLIRAYSSKPNFFAKADSDFLSAIASYGSIAIENAISYQTLSKLDELKSKFILTVTHELRSPLSVVRSLLRTMMAGYVGTLTSEQKDIVSRTLHRTDSLQALIDDLLDLATSKSDLQFRQERVAIQLTDAIKHVVGRFQVMSQEKDLTLKWQFDCQDQTIAIQATNGGVDMILNNLISNAIKYTPRGGQVLVTLRGSEREACLTIADTGIGIPNESLPHVFEEFYRAPNAKLLEKEGTGLGLAISQDLVTRFGGRITVQSQVGQGTVFTLTFPLEP